MIEMKQEDKRTYERLKKELEEANLSEEDRRQLEHELKTLRASFEITAGLPSYEELRRKCLQLLGTEPRGKVDYEKGCCMCGFNRDSVEHWTDEEFEAEFRWMGEGWACRDCYEWHVDSLMGDEENELPI